VHICLFWALLLLLFGRTSPVRPCIVDSTFLFSRPVGLGCAYPPRTHHHLLIFSPYFFVMLFTLLHHLHPLSPTTGYVYQIHPHRMGLAVGSEWPMFLPLPNQSPLIVLLSLSPSLCFGVRCKFFIELAHPAICHTAPPHSSTILTIFHILYHLSLRTFRILLFSES